MRRLLALAVLLLITGCEDDNGPINRVVVAGELTFDTAGGAADLSPFQRVYYSSENPVAIFFVGDARGMAAQFVDAEGLVASNRLLSAKERAARDVDDPAVKASDAANAILGRTGLPDRGFEIVPAQGGYLLYYRYGKLSYVTYAAQVRDKLKLGAAIDMTLLSKLAKAAGVDDTFRTLPQVSSGPSQKPGRLLLFNSAPAPLGAILADNAASLFLEVTQDDKGWIDLDTPAPKSLSDNAAIAAIQQKVRELPPPT